MRQSTRVGSHLHPANFILHNKQDWGEEDTLVVFLLPLPLEEKALSFLIGPQG